VSAVTVWSTEEAGPPSNRLRARRSPAAAAGALVRFAAWALVTSSAGLLLWALVPLLLGWSAHVVVGGSMQPRVAVGDVLLSQDLPARQLRPGMVVVFHDPADPRRVVTHRIRAIEDGEITTRGDANSIDDVDQLHFANVIGVARLQVPFVGLPLHWARSGQWLPLSAVASGLLVATAVMVREPVAGHERSKRPSNDAVPSRRVRHSRYRSRGMLRKPDA
jgi:signal peptidase I